MVRKVELSLQERRRGRKKPSLMVKKDGMILEKLISAKASLSLMPVCIVSSLINTRMLQISLNLQQS